MTRFVIALLTSYVLLGSVLCMSGPIARYLQWGWRDLKSDPAFGEVNWTRLAAVVSLVLAVTVMLWPALLMASMRFPAGRTRPPPEYPDVHWVGDLVSLRDHLLHVWDPTYRPPQYKRELGEWRIGLSTVFRKAIGNLDKKLQGRILEAIASICDDPLTVQGDTKKPLEGNRKGLWRYRIGEYRLIYRPEADSSIVVLVDFIARSAGYSEVGS